MLKKWILIYTYIHPSNIKLSNPIKEDLTPYYRSPSAKNWLIIWNGICWSQRKTLNYKPRCLRDEVHTLRPSRGSKSGYARINLLPTHTSFNIKKIPLLRESLNSSSRTPMWCPLFFSSEHWKPGSKITQNSLTRRNWS